ncbi:M48 family metallopeptidase [Natranaerobius thermophilus]|uniref:YgjP-like metallopeptidase domain-containing protein n=1 Tax=Natranaerobius thermophilus (strain ATCC BAA-1301 / DSM 18059 / JW/NM-WN-LF) TaxID=457570 RepID=B2A5Z8_NATTJ|nr:SprT family zinc-dependent metalloprotease [Natranaerobius thermophilus]ACB85415.1 protein of unknown function DUF45 [Natranaerobius thermophilus JW/NM-WN-LF]
MVISFEYGGEAIQIYIFKRNRTSLEIQVETSGNVRVLAPKGVSESQIRKIVWNRADWIIERVKYFQELRRYTNKQFVSGETFYYLGRAYKLKIVSVNSIKKQGNKFSSPDIPIIGLESHQNVSIRNGYLCVVSCDNDSNSIRTTLLNWYWEQTLNQVKQRVRYYQPYIKYRPSGIKVRDQKRLWASCTSKNYLHFNWRCSMAPEAVLDYLVVHEMSHLIHKNHSSQFWKYVGNILPDYKWRRQWLKNHGLKLDF